MSRFRLSLHWPFGQLAEQFPDWHAPGGHDPVGQVPEAHEPQRPLPQLPLAQQPPFALQQPFGHVPVEQPPFTPLDVLGE